MSGPLWFAPFILALAGLLVVSASAPHPGSRQQAFSASAPARSDTGNVCPPGDAGLRSMVVGFVTSEGTPVIPVPRIDSSKNPPEPYTPPLDSSEMRLRSRSGRPEIGVPRMKPEDVRLVTDENGLAVCQTFRRAGDLDSLSGNGENRLEQAIYKAGDYYFMPSRQIDRDADPDDFALVGTTLAIYDDGLNGIRTLLY